MNYIVDQASISLEDASSKARQDVTKIAADMGFKPFVLKNSYRSDLLSMLYDLAGVERQLLSFVKTLRAGDSVVVQYPFRAHTLPLLKSFCRCARDRNVKTVALVHDIQSIIDNRGETPSDRGFANRFRSDSLSLACFDKIIVHNPAMAEWLERAGGVSPHKLVNLQLFDYLLDELPQRTCNPSIVSFAGNLDPKRTGFIYNFPGNSAFRLELFGPNYSDVNTASDSIWYRGVCAPDELTSRLSGAYGLIWSGSSVETCEWPSGGYLMFNNPHKLSLYYASGLIPIVWDRSAVAAFVRETKSGLVISSLTELDGLLTSINPGDRNRLKENADSIGEKVRTGAFLKAALSKALG